MEILNVPSYGYLTNKDNMIKSLQSAYSYINSVRQEVEDFMTEVTDPKDNILWMGAGQSYSDIMNPSHMVPSSSLLRVSVDVSCAAGDRIVIVIDSEYGSHFHRADMNGFEIPFTETQETVGVRSYLVLTSENTYQAGTYNIDINS